MTARYVPKKDNIFVTVMVGEQFCNSLLGSMDKLLSVRSQGTEHETSSINCVLN